MTITTQISALIGLSCAAGSWVSTSAAVPTWNVDLGNSTLVMNTATYADNGANGFRFGGIWDEDTDATGIFQPNYVLGPDTFDLGASLSIVSRDRDNSVPYSTTASAVTVITIDGIGSNTLEVLWRTNTLNDNFGGDGFDATSWALVLATIQATIEGVTPGTPVTIDYDWNYFGTAETQHEDLIEDPESAEGALGFSADTGDGPGIVFAATFDSQDAAPDAGTDADNGSFSFTTSNPQSYVGISTTSTSQARTQWPGVGPFDEDLGGSEFIGRVTLVVTPEPGSVMVILLIAAVGAARPRRCRARSRIRL